MKQSERQGFGSQVLRIFLPLIILHSLLIGCNQREIATGLDQRQANEIVALLSEYGIVSNSSKGTGRNSSYTVSARSGSYHQAITLLHKNKLPSPTEPSFDELVAQKGLIPNSREIEALRLDHALGKEIEDIIENHPEVRSAKVIVRLRYISEGSKPGVAAVVQTVERPKLGLEDIIGIVEEVVPGIAVDNIHVTIAPWKPAKLTMASEGVSNNGEISLSVPLTPFFLWRVPAGDLESMILALVLALLVIFIVGLSFGYLASFYRKSKTMRMSYQGGSPLIMNKPNVDQQSLPGV